jgi:hypothetical protein
LRLEHFIDREKIATETLIRNWSASMRTRRNSPTVQEALLAAQCLTEDEHEQVEIAASLMGLTAEQVRAQAAKDSSSHLERPTIPAAHQASDRKLVEQKKKHHRLFGFDRHNSQSCK